MANDVTLPGTGAVVSTDQITTLNGAGTASGEQVQRIKVAYGVAGVAQDVNTTNGFPVALLPSTSRVGQVQLTGGPTSAALGLGSTVTAYGSLRTTAEPTGLFNDPFDGTSIDVANRWNTPTLSGFVFTQGSGNLIITTNTTNGNYAFMDSIPTFVPIGVNFLALGCTILLENQVSNLFALNQHRFIGLGSHPASFATTTPLNDAIGFEIGVDGILYASVWAGGVSKFRSSVSLLGATLNSLLTNGLPIRLGIGQRADSIIFYVGSLEYPAQVFQVSTAGFTLPNVQALPIRIAAINATSGTVGASTFTVSTLGIGDTGGNAFAIKDGVYNWRTSTIKPASTNVALTDTSLVVQDINIGNQADVMASSEVGTFSLIAMLKRVSSKLPANFGAQTNSASVAVTQSQETGNGAITTQNLTPTGNGTAGSNVQIITTNASTMTIQVYGTYTGPLSIQFTPDGFDWFTLTAPSILNMATGVFSSTIPSGATGVYQIGVAGNLGARITANSAVTGQANITIICTSAISGVAMDPNIGIQADTAATTDAGTFSLISLFKRLLAKFPAAIGIQTPAASLSVIQAVDSATGNITILNANLATGTPTANSFIALSMNGSSTAAVQITGTWTGTLIAQATLDGVNWSTLGGFPLLNVATGVAAANFASASVGVWQLDAGGFTQIRITASAAMTGTAVVTVKTAHAVSMVGMDSPLPAGSNLLGNVGGNGAAAATATGNPFRAGGTAATANPTAVTTGQTSNVMTDKLGRLVTVPGHARDLTSWTGTTIAVTAATTIVAAQGAGVFADLTNLTITNSSATAIQVTISDGTKTFIVQVPAGGGIVQQFPTPLRASSANVAWTAAANAAVTSYYVMAAFVQNL